jgi:hypothetical protein
MCILLKENWLELKEIKRPIPNDIKGLAKCKEWAILHDALIDIGCNSLANHFNHYTHTHVRSCWLLIFIEDEELPLIGTQTAIQWLDISVPKFKKLVANNKITPRDWYVNPHYKSGPKCPLWYPDDILSLTT